MVTSLAEWELDAPGHLQCDYPHRTSKCLQMDNIGVYSDMLEAQVIKSYVQRIPGHNERVRLGVLPPHGVIHAQEQQGLTGQLEITMETMAT